MLIPALEDPEPRYFPYALPHPCYILTYSFLKRVHAHAAAALINFCEGVEQDTLLSYLDPIVKRLKITE